MKPIFSGALLVGGSLLGQSAPAQTGAPSPALAAQKTWDEVRAFTAELDSDIAARRLNEVHDAAFNVRDAVRDLRDESSALTPAQHARLDALIREGDAIVDDLHESGDHNDGRSATLKLRLLHQRLDQIAALFPAGTLKPIGPIMAYGPVKDPVCRMVVDPATAAAKIARGGQMYYFCSPGDARTFQQNPAPYVALSDELAWGKPKTYILTSQARGEKMAQPLAGRVAHLVFGVRETGHTQLVSRFQRVHERMIHLIMVKDDLSWFAHEHPQLGRDGRLYLDWTFPTFGRYWLFADLTPQDGANQILKTEVRVGGPQIGPAARRVPDASLTKTVDGVEVALQVTPNLVAGHQALLTYTLKRDGQPLTDLQPYLGAMGHVMAIHQNGRDVVHTHAVAPSLDPLTGLNVTPALATPSGPNVSFKLTLPTSGIYRVWAQFQRGQQVITVPFTFDVQGNPMKHSTKVLTTLAAGAIATTPSLAAPKIPANAQKITVTLPVGYKAGAATVKAGRPVALTFYLKANAGCGNEVVVPAAKWRQTLKVGEKATVVYTPTKSGALRFACGMDHFKGSILVK